VNWLGSAKFTNEGAYLFRKLGAFWGTNNTDHQARICHSTTVTGVANTWGYGAMTNSFNDIRNSKTQIIWGGNSAKAHPVSLQHLLEGAELNNANVIVVDPRMTRTAAHATEYVRLRPGTDIPVLYGMMWHILKNGWEDKEFIAQRVYGFDDVRKEIEKWTPEEVERVSGVTGEAQARRRDVRHSEAGNINLVHGPNAAHGRHRQCAGELHRAAAHRQCRQAGDRREHLPRP
jgi:formate dehydrogenase major subunit